MVAAENRYRDIHEKDPRSLLRPDTLDGIRQETYSHPGPRPEVGTGNFGRFVDPLGAKSNTYQSNKSELSEPKSGSLGSIESENPNRRALEEPGTEARDTKPNASKTKGDPPPSPIENGDTNKVPSSHPARDHRAQRSEGNNRSALEKKAPVKPELKSRGLGAGQTNEGSKSSDIPQQPTAPENIQKSSDKKPPLSTPEKLEKAIDWKSDGNGRFTAVLDHKESGYELRLTSKNAEDHAAGLEEVHTVFSDGREEQIYKTDAEGWYQEINGSKVRMQGDLRVNDKTSVLTQVLRRDIDGPDGALKETTRIVQHLTNGGSVHTVNRMDGSSSAIEYDQTGEPKKWTETASDGTSSVFTAKRLGDRQIEWTGTPSSLGQEAPKRYNRHIEDNGSITWTDKPRSSEASTKPVKQHVLNSAGDHVVDGDGIKYAFNHRGDIVSMKYDKPVQFEGRQTDQIDIAYRGGQKGESKIIDSLTLRLNGKVVETLNREHTNNEDQHNAKNTWISIDSQRKQTHRIGDYAINGKGNLLTTEPVIERAGTRSAAPTPQFIIRDPLKQVTDTTDSYHKPAAGLDIPVPGESGYDGKSETSKSDEDKLFAQREKLEKRDQPESRDKPYPKQHEYFRGTLKEAMAEAARTGKPVVFKFTASWCGPCHTMEPDMQKAIKQYGNDAIFVKADIDEPEYKRLSQHYKIQGVPTTMVASIEKDRFGHLGLHKVDANTGLMNLSGLNRFLQPNISTARRQMRDRGFGIEGQKPNQNQRANPNSGDKVAKLDELDFRTAELYKWVV